MALMRSPWKFFAFSAVLLFLLAGPAHALTSTINDSGTPNNQTLNNTTSPFGVFRNISLFDMPSGQVVTDSFSGDWSGGLGNSAAVRITFNSSSEASYSFNVNLEHGSGSSSAPNYTFTGIILKSNSAFSNSGATVLLNDTKTLSHDGAQDQFTFLFKEGVFASLSNGVLVETSCGTGCGYYSLTANHIPEPGTLLMIGSGLAGLAVAARRRKS